MGQKAWENYDWKTHMSTSVHYSTIYRSQDMETTWLSIYKWMDKEVVVQIYNRIVLIHKKE